VSGSLPTCDRHLRQPLSGVPLPGLGPPSASSLTADRQAGHPTRCGSSICETRTQPMPARWVVGWPHEKPRGACLIAASAATETAPYCPSRVAVLARQAPSRPTAARACRRPNAPKPSSASPPEPVSPRTNDALQPLAARTALQASVAARRPPTPSAASATDHAHRRSRSAEAALRTCDPPAPVPSSLLRTSRQGSVLLLIPKTFGNGWHPGSQRRVPP